MRARYEDLPTAQWTPEEAANHLTQTFDAACQSWPDEMEPYVVMLADSTTENRVEIMRRGLRETTKTRFILST